MHCLSVIFTALFKWMDKYINQDLVAFLVKDYRVFNGPHGRSLRLFAQSAPFQRNSDSIRGFVYPSVTMSAHDDQVGNCEKRISAPAHPSATGVGHVSGLVNSSLGRSLCLFACANHSAHYTHSLYSKQQRTL